MSEPIAPKAGVDRYGTAVVALLFGLLLAGWVVVMLALVFLTRALGGGWTELAGGLNPVNQKPTDWWFWWCIELIPPAGIVPAFVLALRGRWRVALCLIPVVIAVEAAGGVLVYYIDRALL